MDAKILCLGALTCGDASGYEIKKMFEDGPFAHFHQVSFGSIYPSLAKLCEQGKVTMRKEMQEGRPDKKVYTLTDKGNKSLYQAMKKTPAADKLRSEVMVMFFLHEYLDQDHLHEVLDQQLNFYRSLSEKLEALDDDTVAPGRMFVRGLGRVLYRTLVNYMEENAHLLLTNKKRLGQ